MRTLHLAMICFTILLCFILLCVVIEEWINGKYGKGKDGEN